MTLSRFTAAVVLGLLLPVLTTAVVRPGRNAELTADVKRKLAGNPLVSDPINGDSVVQKIVGLQQEILANGGCGPNLCFGIDGSKFIAQADYQAQINFMAVVAGTIDLPNSLAKPRYMAYEYGARVKTISAPTEDVETFYDRLSANPGGPTARFTFLAPALLRCRNIMERDQFRNGANKIVLIGDGRTNFLAKSVSYQEADKFQPPYMNGAICAITVNNPDLRFLNRVTQNPARVLHVSDTSQFINLLDMVVRDVCNIV